MTLAPKIGLSLAALATLAFAGALWATYGDLVYFDALAAGFMSCFG